MKKISYIFSLVLVVTILLSSFAQAQERKRWSPQAKGTVIGAGAGAAAGALIHKRNRAVGGVVGGVVGGATGYAIGKHRDNKNKEAARIAEANREAAYQAEVSRTAANRERVVSKKTDPPKAIAVARKPTPPAATYNGFVANGSQMAYNASQNQLPFALNAAYLPNEHYGDSSKPYSTSEYRRKSW